MSGIHDDELILFHYRDGLPAQRLDDIEQELAGSASLRLRYAQLRADLAAIDREPDVEPAPGFEERLWRRLQSSISESAPATSAAAESNVIAWRAAHRVATPEHGQRFEPPGHRNNFRWGVAFASAAAVALAVGMFLLRGAPREAVLARQAARVVVAPDVLAQRVLTMKVADHLRSTEAMLLSVLNDRGSALDDPTRSELLASLAQDNRLYSLAVARNGNRTLAGFLGSLQSILIELANESSSGGIQAREGLREFIGSTDLLFQVRAVETHLRSGLRSA